MENLHRRLRLSVEQQPPNTNCSPKANAFTVTPGDGIHRRQDNTSPLTTSTRATGMQARRFDKQTLNVSDSTPGREEKRRRSCHQEEAAAVRIGAAARGHLVRKRAEEGSAQERCVLETKEVGENIVTPGAREENKDLGTASGPLRVTSAAASREETDTKVTAAPFAARDESAQVEALGVVGVRAFFESLGLGTCTNRLRESIGGIDGAELARIARASDPDAELLAAGVSARLHRVKLLSALGVSGEVTGVAVPSTSPVLEKNIPSGGGGGGGGLARVAAVAALHMVRRLRKEQGFVAGVLCTRSGSTPNRSRVELGQELPPRADDKDAWDACGGIASGGPKETGGTGAAAPRSEGMCFVSLMLPELEEVLSTQLTLSSQVHYRIYRSRPKIHSHVQIGWFGHLTRREDQIAERPND